MSFATNSAINARARRIAIPAWARSFALVAIVAATVFALSATTARAQGPAINESFSSCNSVICIDAPPEGPQGLDGSGGWGWDSAANKPVTELKQNHEYPFTVTVLQPGTPFCGTGDTLSITLTYSSRDFSLSPTDSAGNTGSNPFDRGGVETFTYSGNFLCHSDQSIAYTFKPLHLTDTALVTATVNVAGNQVAETFPVSIISCGHK